MLFSSNIFICIFLPCVILSYYIFKKSNFKNYILLFSSLFFYAWGEPLFVILMLVSIFSNYIIGCGIGKCTGNKLNNFLLIIGVIFNFSFLVVFKYSNFIIENINGIFSTEFQFLDISLPIGISFYTFQAVSYIIDVYRGDVKYQKNLMVLGLYISFFPQLIAGPILRYDQVCEQIKDREESLEKFSNGVTRFIIGLSKKMIIANTFSIVSDKAFLLAETNELSVLMAWLGAISYTFQIYFDFSGYSDMAIGLGKMFGFNFPENFNYPYISSSITEFWRRWHISLGSWFRDYVYFPLGGSRTSKLKTIRNLAVVWLLTGIWHGASWNFVIWGAMYGLLIIIEKTFYLHKKDKGVICKALSVIITLVFVVFGWVLFGAKSLDSAGNQILTMLGVCSTGFMDDLFVFYIKENYIILIAAFFLSTPFPKKFLCRCIGNLPGKYSGIIVKTIIIMFLFVVSYTKVVSDAYNPFLYFNF